MNLADQIAELSINHYNKLPKTGKPTVKEWTIMATIVEENIKTQEFKVVSLGTGSKCIGANKLCANGTILNDSHAEVICRRAFLRYLYEQIDLCLSKSESIFQFDENLQKCQLKEDYHYHLFCSQIPCGDAAIHPKQLDDNLTGDCLNEFALNKPGDKRKTVLDIHRTGAKCLKTEMKQDPHEIGINYHVTGVLRTKPGRGDPTLSLSCSDKLARWIRVGIQGALLTLLVDKPIHIESIIFAKNIPYSEEALMRSLILRFPQDNGKNMKVPTIIQSNVCFPQKQDNLELCPSSIIWSNVRERPLEIAVNGRKQGVTKKNINSEKSQLLICKKQLSNNFINIINKYNNFNFEIKHLTDTNNILSYERLKNSCTEYYKIWNFIKNDIFKNWTCKDRKFIQFNVLNKDLT